MNSNVIDVSEPWFSFLASGRKPVEGIKGSPRWQYLDVGDIVQFRDADNTIRTFRGQVVELTNYIGERALQDYLEAETLDRTLPGVDSLEEGEQIYLQWWRPEEIALYGILALTIQVLPN
jgi:ASC-1-like (ASCH) protein